MQRFMHLPTALFMLFPLCAVCKISVTLALFETNMIPNAHKLPRIPSALLVSVYCLFNYIFNKYLFICVNFFVF